MQQIHVDKMEPLTADTLRNENLLVQNIVLQAAYDYRKARKDIEKARKLPPEKEEKANDLIVSAQAVIDEVNRFFRSKWFGKLTMVDPEGLIYKLEHEICHKRHHRRHYDN
ncbi:MAG: hypothetical protein RSF84_09440 [Ruthenibacterium sp.]